MNRLAVILISMALIARPGNGHLRLKKTCKASDPTATNRTIIPSAINSLDCARACDAIFFCNYASFHGTECAIYTDDAACGTTVGSTADVYKVCILSNVTVSDVCGSLEFSHMVDPGCESGWYRFIGSCYLVTKVETNWTTLMANCMSIDAFPVAVSYAAEGTFLTQLLEYSNVPNATVWIGMGSFGAGSIFWWNGEPWGYLNWAEGQPSYSITGVVSLNSVDAKWQIEEGSLSKFGVCEKALSVA